MDLLINSVLGRCDCRPEVVVQVVQLLTNRKTINSFGSIITRCEAI